MDDNRTTRVVAVMAGNGFFLSKIADHWIQEGWPLLIRTIAFTLVALTGVSSAYLSLFGRPEKRWPFALELFSAFCFALCAFGWLWVVAISK
jgi:hypothetical protein